MNKTNKTAGAIALALAAQAAFIAPAMAQNPAPLKATVIHWWTSGGESAAIRQFADAYNKAGGQWIDQAIAGADQSRATTINRIVGGNAPVAAQFNTSQQFRDIVDQGLLNNIDDVAIKGNWDQIMPPSILNAIKVKGHSMRRPSASTCRPGSSIRKLPSRKPVSPTNRRPGMNSWPTWRN